jgi:TPR repeat protein
MERVKVNYITAASQGFAAAQSSLGYFYNIGEGVAQDLKEGVRWTRKAAEQGDAQAQDKPRNHVQIGPGGWFKTTKRQRGGFEKQQIKGMCMRSAPSLVCMPVAKELLKTPRRRLTGFGKAQTKEMPMHNTPSLLCISLARG